MAKVPNFDIYNVDNIDTFDRLHMTLCNTPKELDQNKLIRTIIQFKSKLDQPYGHIIYGNFLMILFKYSNISNVFPILYNWLVNDWNIDEETIQIIQDHKLNRYIISNDYKHDLINKMMDINAIYSDLDIIILCEMKNFNCILKLIKKIKLNDDNIKEILKSINALYIFMINKKTFNTIIKILELLYENYPDYPYQTFINNIRKKSRKRNIKNHHRFSQIKNILIN